MLPSYNRHQTYAWNYDHPPPLPDRAVTGSVLRWPGEWSCCGLPLTAPLAVAAGPLLNGAWTEYYAKLGFDLLTYKTVRRQAREAYPMPNLQPVIVPKGFHAEADVCAVSEVTDSWAISFGMPSQAPEQWTADVRMTRDRLPTHQWLSVSVVATPTPDASIEQVAEDYADCAELACEHGADLVELNLSCPNVTSCDGQIYLDPPAAHTICEAVRRRVRDIPLLLKIGYFEDEGPMAKLIDHVSGLVTGLVTLNCLARRIRQDSGWLFDGQSRGIGGHAIHLCAVNQVERLVHRIHRQGVKLEVIGCGGVTSLNDVNRFLDAGAGCIQMATRAMLEPTCGLRLRREAAARPIA